MFFKKFIDKREERDGAIVRGRGRGGRGFRNGYDRRNFPVKRNKTRGD